MGKQIVAVVGAGISGLAIAKNLREEGFAVTVFEKRDSVGGVWAYSDDENTTSTLPSTLSNVSKFMNSFTDFPVPDDSPAYLTAPQVCDYLKSYATHFDVNRDVQLNTSVRWVKRNAEDTRWQVCTSTDDNEKTSDFDKVVFCGGLYEKAVTPTFEGQEKFKGKILHVQAFKRPSDFKDMRVLVVGIGNSAADTSTALIGSAKNIYLSHRGGVQIVPRVCLGAPFDLVLTRQKMTIRSVLDAYVPSLSAWFFDAIFAYYSKKSFKFDPSWRFLPAPTLATHQPVISDNLVSSLWEGSITSVQGLKSFLSANTVQLTDGTTLEVDAVILCTGYESGFSLTPDFSPFDPVESTDKGSPLPRLYQNIFPPKYADSLAYMNYAALTDGATTIIDVVAMAVTQVFKNPSLLPSQSAMNAHIDDHHAWVQNLSKNDNVYAGIVRPGPWYAFLNDMAGTGVNEKLGYGWEGWKFWWKDRELCNLMIKGVMTPFMYRIFDGRRKKWEGAREAILKANKMVEIYR